jgi:hypothetical protein
MILCMNWMIIVLLLLNLHDKMVYMHITCSWVKLMMNNVVVDKLMMNSWLVVVVVVVVVVRCCCWWMEPWVTIIFELVMICVVYFFEVLWKWVKWWILLGECFGSNFIWIWVSFHVWNRLDNPWDQIWHREVKIGVLRWKWGFSCGLLASRVKLLAMASCTGQYPLFRVLASFSLVSVLIWFLV